MFLCDCARGAARPHIEPDVVEERLAAILCPLMQLENVSVEDNFFMLGGHSLMGTQLIARIRDAFGVEITLRALFDSPTVTGISAEIERLILAKLEQSDGDTGHEGPGFGDPL